VALAVCFSVVLLASGGVHAQDCNELVRQLRDANSEAFNEYPQLNSVKQDILLMFYSRERGTCPEDLYSLGVLSKSFIEKFDTAYRLSRSPDPEDNARAVELAEELKAETATIEEGAESFDVEAEDLVNSAQQAVSAFLVNLANSYALEAGSTNQTKKVIAFYRQAGRAYELAGSELEAASFKIKAQALEEVYSRDMETADGLFREASAAYATAAPLLREGFFSRVTAYKLLRRSQLMAGDALEIYEYHSEEEKIDQAQNLLGEIKQARRLLVFQLAIYFAGLCIVITLLAFYTIRVLKTWYNDSLDCSLGNELVQVKGNEGY